MTGAFYGLGNLALEFQGSTGDAAGQNLTLLVEELLEEFCVLVINIFDTGFLEAALFFLANINFGRVEVADFSILCHNYSSFLLYFSRRFSASAMASLSIAKVRKRMMRSSRRY